MFIDNDSEREYSNEIPEIISQFKALKLRLNLKDQLNNMTKHNLKDQQ